MKAYFVRRKGWSRLTGNELPNDVLTIAHLGNPKRRVICCHHSTPTKEESEMSQELLQIIKKGIEDKVAEIYDDVEKELIDRLRENRRKHIAEVAVHIIQNCLPHSVSEHEITIRIKP